MTPQQFVIWLKGFSKAANAYNITPAQWDAIVKELDKVKDSIDPILTYSNTSTSLEYPEGTTISYTTKQQLND